MRRVLVALLVVVVVMVIVAFVLLRPGRNQAQAAATETVPVQRGSLTSYVSAAGNVEAASSTDLPFPMAGQVSAVHVALGDQVQAGQLLVELDATDLNLSVAQAQQSLTVSEQQLAKAQAGATEPAVAAARAALDSAQQNLAKVLAGPTPDEVAAARSALQAAQAKYDLLRAGPTADAFASAQASLDKATIAVQQAQVDYADKADDPSSAPAALAAYQQALLDYQAAQAAFGTATQPASEADLQAALSQVQQAQQSLDALEQSPTAADVAAAQAQVASAQSQLDALTAGPTSEDVAIAQSNVEQSRLALQKAQRALEDARVVAPFAGTVTALDATVGRFVGLTDVAVSIVDLSVLQVEAPVAEVDIAKVQANQPVEIALDALPGVALQGHVSHVGQVATITQGVVNYPVLIVLDNPDAAVRPGMTATMRVVVAQQENVLLIPLAALQQSGTQQVVRVVHGTQIDEVPVQVGSNNGSLVEVVSGLQEGDQVVIGSSAGGAGGAGGGPGFFGVGGGQGQRRQATP
jgi:HlyD family secretion protein